MRLGVLVSGNLGIVILNVLMGNYEICFVMTDKSSKNIQETCVQKRIHLFIGNPRNGNCTSFIADKEIDILISINYLFIIDYDLINLPKKLAFNIHGSLLPKYRGRTPHVWAIINNEEFTGITAHILDENCDTGDILEQKTIPIDKRDTGADILLKFQKEYPILIKNVLTAIEKNIINPTAQNEIFATYFGKRTPEDGEIDWNWHKERINNWIRAQAYPYPGAFTFQGTEKIIIDEIDFDSYGYLQDMPNGQILTLNPLRIKTPNGVVIVNRLRNITNSLKVKMILSSEK